MALPDGRSCEPADGVGTEPPVSLVDDLPPYPRGTLAGGIVWADVLTGITADEQARRPRDAA